MLIDQDSQQPTAGGELPPPLVPETDLTSAYSEARPCQDCKFATVIYVTGHRSFWLIPQGVLDKIETSADRLQAAATRDTLEQRMAELEKAGLTDLFLPATAQSFLLPMEQNEWNELVRENQAAERESERLGQEIEVAEKRYLEQVEALGDGESYYRNRLSLTAEWHHRRQQIQDKRDALQDTIDDRKDRLDELRDQGFEAAREAGFDVVNGNLYSPEQKGIKQLLEDYMDARQAFEDDEFEDKEETEHFIKAIRRNRTFMAYELDQETPSRRRLEEYLTALNVLEGEMLDYATTILDLANIGIATPEYALANGQSKVTDGIIELADFKRLQWDIEQLTEDMKEQGGIWHQVIGRNGPAPAAELLSYQVRIEDCEAQQEQLRCTARERAEALVPPRMFVWNPAEYQASPYKSLMRPGVPLREFSLPGGGSTLRHFSLRDLPGGEEHLDDDNDVLGTMLDLAKALKAAQKPGKDEALEKLLTAQGAKKYPLDGHWFDNNGLFLPERFYDSIKDEGVLDLQSQEDLDAWGIRLRSFLFESEAKRHLLGFDDSYTGQFIRLVISGIPGDLGEELQNTLNVEVLTGANGPSLALPDYGKDDEGRRKLGYTLADTAVGANLTWRQGQLDLLSMKFPKPEEAETVILPYISEGGRNELEVGRLYCELDVKCWGHVGARILLSHSVGVELVEGQGVQVTGIDPKQRAVDGAKFDAFAGVQAGLMARAEMKWAIPDRLRQSEKWRLINEDVPEWTTLGVVNGELVGSAGIGAGGDISIGLKNKRLVLRVKGKVVAGLGGGMSMGVELAYDTLPLWMRLLQQELHDNGYRRVYWIDPEAFEYMSMLMNLCLSTALKISFLAAQSYDFVQKVYDDFYSSENAGVVAVRIHEAIEIAEGRLIPTDDVPRVTLNEYKSWFLGLQPEAIGPMLHNLVSEPVEFEGDDGQEPKTAEEMLKLQQISILQCLRWINDSELVRPESYRGATPNRIQRQFEESVTRMNTHGTKPEGDPRTVARNNVARLDEFMGRDIVQPIDNRRFQGYRTLRKKFSLHLWEQV
ncbi:hypothetical protein D777_02111 [Marinobacter nitratireducens]|uniref:Uncharacterized protein n=1 Tax=Marinobacter nitratireducens TaxID=1137280 RepID=A0A072N1W3_9GAMM|nr:hypothetical protein [Marinobacter nitratireducens]KEF30958.1 hypothetical protein D777_02111 [Marinobacter nitratireducens]